MIEIIPVGSKVTCDPPPTDTDEDYLVLTDDLNYPAQLEKNGWVADTSYSGEYFQSFKRGLVNYIVTFDPGFAKRFLAASHVAKKLNLLKKEDRIMLFQAVLYGNKGEG